MKLVNIVLSEFIKLLPKRFSWEQFSLRNYIPRHIHNIGIKVKINENHGLTNDNFYYTVPK